MEAQVDKLVHRLKNLENDKQRFSKIIDSGRVLHLGQLTHAACLNEQSRNLPIESSGIPFDGQQWLYTCTLGSGTDQPIKPVSIVGLVTPLSGLSAEVRNFVIRPRSITPMRHYVLDLGGKKPTAKVLRTSTRSKDVPCQVAQSLYTFAFLTQRRQSLAAESRKPAAPVRGDIAGSRIRNVSEFIDAHV